MATRLRAAHAAARTVQLKVRFGDFRTITRSRTLAAPTDLAADIARVARDLLRSLEVGAGVRLLGVSAQQLVRRDPGRRPGTDPAGRSGTEPGTEPGGADQGTLFPDPDCGADEPGGTATPAAGERRQAALERRWTRSGPGSVLVP